ncbi:hypothetical protein GH714_022489 [Hevea brasiliensis]|uniref:Myb-like domain-containing protein n=1 Tax=Hevea brasiliensis TaxID=3981 RepID=A0A6A6LIM1_HEVBR|nr:hypothetical protein GH714_022489 [Hevea brasiliensis]
MDDTEDDARYPPNPYGVNHQQGYGSSNRQKLPVKNSPYSRTVGNQYVDDDEEDENEGEDEEELGEDDGENNQNNGIQYVGKEVDDDDYDEDDEDADVDEEEDEEDNQKNYSRRINDVDLERHPKMRKLKSIVSSYEFAPRVPAPPVTASSAPKPSFAGRNPLTDWTEHETFVLLDAWGDKFVQRGRKSLRSEEWQEVAEKQGGLSCGVDSGEYVFMSPKVYLNRANGLDEMRDSPGNSEAADEAADVGTREMRMDFHRDLEMQKRQIMERAQAEIAKIQQGDDDNNDISADNASG